VTRLVLLLIVLLAGCAPRSHDGVGTVIDVRADLHQIMLDHDDIAGLMPAMRMTFDVPDAALLSGIRVGDRIRFDLVADGEQFRIVSLEKIAGEQRADGPTAQAGFDAVIPEEDRAPPFALIDQDGNARSLDALRGRVVLLDFIFTNCNGPCPVSTSNRVQLQKSLPDAMRQHMQFVSISLDPLRDTPEELRRYALERGADLANWSFLTGGPEEVDNVLRSYGVGVARGADGDVQHVVVSFLIDPEGRITKRYFGLEHDTSEIIRDLAAAAPVRG
jgi:protein SCO1